MHVAGIKPLADTAKCFHIMLAKSLDTGFNYMNFYIWPAKNTLLYLQTPLEKDTGARKGGWGQTE